MTQRYTVTAKAGPKVAGRRVRIGDILELTENAARAELLAGSIVAAENAAPVADEVVSGEAPADTVIETKKKR